MAAVFGIGSGHEVSIYTHHGNWAIDKRLRVITTIMLFKNSKSTKELKETKE